MSGGKKQEAPDYAPGLPALLMAAPLAVLAVLALVWAVVWTGPLRGWLASFEPLADLAAREELWWGPLWARVAVPVVAVVLCIALVRPQWRAVRTWRLRRELAELLPAIGVTVRGGVPPRLLSVRYSGSGRTLVFDSRRGHSAELVARHRAGLAAGLGLSPDAVNIRQDGRRVLVELLERPDFEQVER